MRPSGNDWSNDDGWGGGSGGGGDGGDGFYIEYEAFQHAERALDGPARDQLNTLRQTVQQHHVDQPGFGQVGQELATAFAHAQHGFAGRLAAAGSKAHKFATNLKASEKRWMETEAANMIQEYQ